ncbi:toprim domain-containing protein [Paenibacillus vulneris]|uniref:DNA primase n=1 Tax=Paenibacillus vulneris TaxID=1133364 RepID=A0ABW3UJD6_9BACL
MKIDAQLLKEKILNDNKIEDILIALGCHNIRKGRTFYTASNPDGDAPSAINVSLDTLRVLNHTRPDFPEKADIIDLVEYISKLYFSQAIYWICKVCGYDYYQQEEYKKEIIEDPCLLVLDQIEPKNSNHGHDDSPLRKLDESILNEYVTLPYEEWIIKEEITPYVQNMFQIGFSIRDNCITIPIRDELGNLVGVKGRTILDYVKLKTSKYWYPYPTPKSHILYGLDKALPYIKELKEVIVYEAEKSVLKSFSYGFCNAVSIGGHDLSQQQVLKLEKLGVNVILAFDKNVSNDEWRREINKFLLKERLYVIYEKKNSILGEKDAPIDLGLEAFIKLYNEEKYKVK